MQNRPMTDAAAPDNFSDLVARANNGDASATDQLFTTLYKELHRLAHREALVAIIAPWMLERSTAEWTALLEPNAVPCAPILELPDVFKHPQVVELGIQVEL